MLQFHVNVFFVLPLIIIFLKVFGCLCFSFLRPYNKHKTNFRSSSCVFLGYHSQYHGYRCMDLKTNKIHMAHHVRFDEFRFPFTGPLMLCHLINLHIIHLRSVHLSNLLVAFPLCLLHSHLLLKYLLIFCITFP